jgi:hypothetical protein
MLGLIFLFSPPNTDCEDESFVASYFIDSLLKIVEPISNVCVRLLAASSLEFYRYRYYP